MSNRRGTRYGRRIASGGESHDHKISGTTFQLLPSGVTIDKNAGIVTAGGVPVNFSSSGVTVGKIDFGQGTQYKFYRGTAPLTKVAPSGGGTSLSAGTIQVTTGLTTLSDFFFSVQGVTSPTIKRYQGLQIGWQRGYISAGGVTLWLAGVTNDGTKATAVPTLRDWSGITINWLAIGV